MQNFNPVVQDSIYDPNSPSSMSLALFESHGSKIVGSLFLASGEGLHPVIILLHGFPGNEVNFDLAHVFRRQGFNVLVFHFRGCWGSDGDYSWKNCNEDTQAAVDFLKSDYARENFRVDGSKIILAGHSMGGFAALYTSIFNDGIKNVVSIAGFNSGAFGDILESSRLIYDYSLQTIISSIPFIRNATAESLLDEYIANRREWNLLNYIDKLSQKKLLLIGAMHDMIAPTDIHHKPLVERLEKEKAEMQSSILECGHSFADKRIELAQLISDWLYKINF